MDAKYVLASTGEAMCWKDVAVGFLAYLAIVSLIVGIGNLIPFLLYNKGEHGKYVGLKKASRKYFLVTSIIFLALCPVSIAINVFVCCFA